MTAKTKSWMEVILATFGAAILGGLVAWGAMTVRVQALESEAVETRQDVRVLQMSDAKNSEWQAWMTKGMEKLLRDVETLTKDAK